MLPMVPKDQLPGCQLEHIMKVAKDAVFVVFLSFSIAISGRESEFVAVPIETT